MNVGMVLCIDEANRSAWLSSPDGSERHRTDISIRQVRGLLKTGLITKRGRQNTTYTTFVISAKGQAEVRRIKHREAQSMTKPSALIDTGAKEQRPKQQRKTKVSRSSRVVGAPHSDRDSLRQALQRARELGFLIYEGS